MFDRRNFLKIETSDGSRIEIRGHPRWLWDGPWLIHPIERLLERASEAHNIRVLDYPREKKSRAIWIFELISAGLSVIAGLLSIALLVLVVKGVREVQTFSTDSLLSIFSIAFIGSLISFGGTQLFSINANLRRQEKLVQSYASVGAGCPFERILRVMNSNMELHRPGNPRFCIKCPLGIDGDSSKKGHLLHNCAVYGQMHDEWLKLSGAKEQLTYR
jgi:hypothetical protein